MAIDKEERRHKRYRYVAEVSGGLPGGGMVLLGHVTDISLGGCRIRLEALADFETGSTVEVCVKSGWVAFRALGTVRRQADDEYMVGISYLQISERGRLELEELVAGLAAIKEL